MPGDITTATVCKKSGKLVVPGLCDADPRGSMVSTEYFAEGTVPTEYCDHHVNVTICAESGMLATEFCPNRVGGVYITGGSPGSADGPYLLSENSATNTCPLHTAPSAPQPAPDTSANTSLGDSSKDKKKNNDKNSDKKPDKTVDKTPTTDKKPDSDSNNNSNSNPDDAEDE